MVNPLTIFSRFILLVAAALGASGVGLGAYAAHGMEKSLLLTGLESSAVAKKVEQAEVGVRYQLLHAGALLVLALSGRLGWSKLLCAAAAAWVLGVALFSGGLYSIALFGTLGHWTIVPSGGLMLMIGWLIIALYALFSGHRTEANSA